MKILLTNDDGIHAPGLGAAIRALRPVGEVFVVAPDREQSGAGASLTLRAPICVRQVSLDSLEAGDGNDLHPVTAYAVEGTPADCCVLGLERVVGPVDLVVSGINAGSNLGWDVLVSGTVGAAIQGYVRGYPAIAISVGSVQDPRFEEAAALLQLIGQRLAPRPVGVLRFLLNINLPSLPWDQIRGVQVTRLGGRSYAESVREERVGPQQRYWIARDRPVGQGDTQGTDLWAMKNHRISITPLQLNLADHEQMPTIESLFAGLPFPLLNSRD